jgi:bacteriocin biosynthesis cyclodehydratase domain-containing protein
MTRPVLAPGLRVLRRSRTQLQIGLGPEHRLLVPDTEPVRRTLGHLTRGEAVPEDDQTRAVLALLAPVLVDSVALVVPHVAAGDAAAAALRDPAGYAALLEGRRHVRVLVSGSLGDTTDPGGLLAAAGLQVDRGPTSGAARPPDVALVLGAGEPDREALDPLLRAGVTHVVVRVVEGSAVVGPFVEPGRTACLRCLDAHQGLDDPLAPVLAGRHALAGDDRRDGVAEPVDSALAALALGWAVRDVVTHVDGGRPSTWSSTVRLAPALASVTRTEWLRHPGCGCGWLHDDPPGNARASRTMAL